MKHIVTVLLFLSLGFSQSANEAGVKKSITQFFDGMRQNDTTLITAVVMPNLSMHTVGKDRRTGEARLHAGNFKQFLGMVGRPKDKAWDEKIHSYIIQIDGSLATAWTEYSFYHGERRTHCGVNTFQLFHDGKVWRIFSISDTRRQTNCVEDK